ncbi:MAG: ComEA family DNA-binding protein [Phormidesmis sp.]
MLKKLLAQVRIHPLHRRLQQEPYYRFRSVEELQLAASWGIVIDANMATIDEWLRLPGISIHQARCLSQLTQRGLAFNCIEDVAAALGMPLQQISPWQVVLQFCYYGSGDIAEGSAEGRLEPVAIAINTASAEQLVAVPAIDIFLARAIIHYRQFGPYQDLADLQDRLRLTAQITAELLHYLRF